MKRLIFGSTAAIILSVGTAMADSAWDTNGDGLIDADEYNTGMSKSTSFQAYDTDGNGTIDPDEFSRTTYKAYDADGDGIWSQTEAGVWKDSTIRSGAEVSQ